MELTVDKDLENATLTVTATFAHPLEKVWELYADPRKMERWWGPPTHPATVVRHELTPGGTVHYFMTSPEGEQFHGIWRVLSVEPHVGFTADDFFADAEGTPVEGMPTTHMDYRFEATDGGARMVCVSRYDTTEELQKTLEMGMEEGLAGAMGQMEAVLAEG
ncbi:SRPBCC family protein [Protaetiibacter mangrovi]|uniref:SRPBCC domain-containing protein n=1 Tax=Protaetiibacter mangrovi TaxID=2970926 RepID=A0ABT1ZI04_9MICO|nr:SRPBCC domain-containing protein [Protaetiibacter mangrovi]MCS0500331.1 SRPBCC domain-containing protein [Protaetiibacter mangrovi]TPX03896.1 SRPBCC domain-containing protein [Schumannella luteola]